MARSQIYDGTNYNIWSVKMKTLFLSMDLWDTVQTGYNDETNKEMQQKDAAALYHIQQGVSDRIFSKIKDAKKAKEAWEILSQLSTKIRHPYTPPSILPPGSQINSLLHSPPPSPPGPQEHSLPSSQGSSPPSSPPSLPPGPQENSPPTSPPHSQGHHPSTSPSILPPGWQGHHPFTSPSILPPGWQGHHPFTSPSILPPGWQVDMRQAGANHLIVATLIATVAFTAGFTMPGGYNGNDGPNQGMAILTREAAFKAFMVTDAMAVSLSFSAVLIHFYVAIVGDGAEVTKLVFTAAYLLIYAAIAMVLAFVTGTYAVLAHSSGLAISVSVIGSLSLLVFLNTDIRQKVADPIAKSISHSVAKAIHDPVAKLIASYTGSEPRGGLMKV